jgi:hypothetical protein
MTFSIIPEKLIFIQWLIGISRTKNIKSLNLRKYFSYMFFLNLKCKDIASKRIVDVTESSKV